MCSEKRESSMNCAFKFRSKDPFVRRPRLYPQPFSDNIRRDRGLDTSDISEGERHLATISEKAQDMVIFMTPCSDYLSAKGKFDLTAILLVLKSAFACQMSERYLAGSAFSMVSGSIFDMIKCCQSVQDVSTDGRHSHDPSMRAFFKCFPH